MYLKSAYFHPTVSVFSFAVFFDQKLWDVFQNFQSTFYKIWYEKKAV